MPQILTVTMNPALDLSTRATRVEPTHKVRCGAPVLHPGGGGINVARVATRLGCESLALYPAGGATGAQLGRLLAAEKVRSEAVAIAGETRESFSVHEEARGLDWRFVLPGPELALSEWQACLERACALAALAGNVLAVASGSLPPGVPADFYGQLGQRLAGCGARLVVDTSGPALAAALEAGVYLVKPSLRELRELTGGLPLDSTAERLAACRALVQQGQAEMVALSLGEQGAMLVTAQGAWSAPALQVPVASTIGAGDSFLGGLVCALAHDETPQEAFRQAMATSAAALLSHGTTLCRAEDVQRLLPHVRVAPL